MPYWNLNYYISCKCNSFKNMCMPSSQLCTLPLRLWAVPLRVVLGGVFMCVLQCLCIISSIIAQIHPSPTFQLPVMPEQWCSNKAILNDEHTFIPCGEEWRLWSKCSEQHNKHRHLTSTDGHILQKATVINTLTVTLSNMSSSVITCKDGLL